jgi:hypothetical protein
MAAMVRNVFAAAMSFGLQKWVLTHGCCIGARAAKWGVSPIQNVMIQIRLRE